MFRKNLHLFLEELFKLDSSSLDLHGLEREIFRVNKDGSIATSPHPASLGDKLYNPYITTDFSESQIELVTPPCDSIAKVHLYLERLLNHVAFHIDETEFLWPFSVPPILKDFYVPIAQYGASPLGQIKYLYRKGLANRYGVNMQAISGIHYNFSFTDDFWKAYFRKPFSQQDINRGYFNLIRNFKRYGWILIVLFGASPFAHETFYQNDPLNFLLNFRKDLYYPDAISIRNSHLGYHSLYQNKLIYSFNSIEEYIEGILACIGISRAKFF